ncbi:DUF4118 domain-containing protein [Streptomyces sp. NPDC058001]|uniref:DUF4118 domain-containing protein n=1 Tax=Streptomyces sp. NPDC058001 TaxID=3346300 RepID=UPI0036E04B03
MTYPLRDRIALGAALVGPLAVTGVLAPFRTHIAAANLALILVVAVVAVSALGNRVAGALAGVSAAVWFDFFLTRPYQTFSIGAGDDITAAVLLLAVGLAVSQLAARARNLRVVTINDAAHLTALHDAARLVQSGSPDAVVEGVRRQLVAVLGLRGCRFEYGTLLGRPARLGQDGWVTVDGRDWDVDKAGWPDGEIELRASAAGRYVGRFMMEPTPGSIPSLQSRVVAVTLADHVGAALETTPRLIES